VKKRIEFPLLELMLIIILLSVLVIFSFPKFVQVGIEARIEALNTTVMNLQSVNRLLYSRALIKGFQNNSLQATEALGEKDAGAYLVYGELRANEADLKRFLESDFIEYATINKMGVIRLYLDSKKNDACYVDYQQAKQEKTLDGQMIIQKASYEIKDTGC